jgi:hypothetical protein
MDVGGEKSAKTTEQLILRAIRLGSPDITRNLD